MRIFNNTDLSTERLLVLYSAEINSVKHRGIESITFNACHIIIFGIDCILLELYEG